MEFADGGDLQKKIDGTKKLYKNIPESTVWKYCIQMINGIKYLHENKIVHRDLKVRFLRKIHIRNFLVFTLVLGGYGFEFKSGSN
jgi:serine/threonine protein kinase